MLAFFILGCAEGSSKQGRETCPQVRDQDKGTGVRDGLMVMIILPCKEKNRGAIMMTKFDHHKILKFFA